MKGILALMLLSVVIPDGERTPQISEIVHPLRASHIFCVNIESLNPAEWTKTTCGFERKIEVVLHLTKVLKGKATCSEDEKVNASIKQIRYGGGRIADNSEYWSSYNLEKGQQYVVVASSADGDVGAMFSKPVTVREVKVGEEIVVPDLEFVLAISKMALPEQVKRLRELLQRDDKIIHSEYIAEYLAALLAVAGNDIGKDLHGLVANVIDLHLTVRGKTCLLNYLFDNMSIMSAKNVPMLKEYVKTLTLSSIRLLIAGDTGSDHTLSPLQSDIIQNCLPRILGKEKDGVVFLREAFESKEREMVIEKLGKLCAKQRIPPSLKETLEQLHNVLQLKNR